MPMRPLPSKPWFTPACEFGKPRDGAVDPLPVRVSFRNCAARCPLGENGPFLVRRLGLAFGPKSHAELATEFLILA
jgi:hypothetical protein